MKKYSIKGSGMKKETKKKKVWIVFEAFQSMVLGLVSKIIFKHCYLMLLVLCLYDFKIPQNALIIMQQMVQPGLAEI